MLNKSSLVAAIFPVHLLSSHLIHDSLFFRMWKLSISGHCQWLRCWAVPVFSVSVHRNRCLGLTSNPVSRKQAWQHRLEQRSCSVGNLATHFYTHCLPKVDCHVSISLGPLVGFRLKYLSGCPTDCHQSMWRFSQMVNPRDLRPLHRQLLGIKFSAVKNVSPNFTSFKIHN